MGQAIMAEGSIAQVQEEVKHLLEANGLILIGFAIGSDMKALGLQDSLSKEWPTYNLISIECKA